MATVPALLLISGLLMLLRTAWRRLRGASHDARRDPIEAIQAEVIAIDALLTRAEEGYHVAGQGTSLGASRRFKEMRQGCACAPHQLATSRADAQKRLRLVRACARS